MAVTNEVSRLDQKPQWQVERVYAKNWRKFAPKFSFVRSRNFICATTTISNHSQFENTRWQLHKTSRPSRFFLNKAALFGIFGVFIASATPAAAGSDSQFCFDHKRNLAYEAGVRRCDGTEVSKATAEALQQRRNDYVRRAIRVGRIVSDRIAPTAAGSGFYINRRGDVVTNYHVVAQCRQIFVLPPEGRLKPASLLASSSERDLAVLSTGTPSSSYAKISPTLPDRGDPVSVVGFPVRKLPRLKPLTVSGNYLGAWNRSGSQPVLNVAARVWHGSSGSPVIDDQGDVVGVVFAKADLPAVYRQSGIVLDDRAFALPSHELRTFLRQNRVPVHANGSANGQEDTYTVRIDCIK